MYSLYPSLSMEPWYLRPIDDFSRQWTHRPAAALPHAGLASDLYRYTPSSGAWANLTGRAAGPPPPARASPGVTSAGDGRIFVFGGYTAAGEGGAGTCSLPFIE